MSDDFMDSDFEEDEDFTSATEHVQSCHDKYMPEDLLQLYGLYKQATVGNCNTDKPGIFHMQGRAKWSAWDGLKNMSKEEAKRLYIAKVKELEPEWETKRAESKRGNSWAVHSIQTAPAENFKPENEKNIFDYVKDGNLDMLKLYLKPENINNLDENGIGLLHWAADRNHCEVLKFLLDCGANVNLQDIDQQTALHYACSIGNHDCIRILLSFQANPNIKDSDGQTCLDVAESESVLDLLQ